MTALHLLRQPPPVKVVLIERRSPIGLGAAYATDDPAHRLNVRAGNMSAWPDRPDDFVAWLKARDLDVGPGGFATRGDYGRYLQGLLSSLAEGPEAAGRLLIVPDEITAIEPAGQGWTLTCGMGRTIAADAVVLALGNPPPRAPEPVSPQLEGLRRLCRRSLALGSRRLADGQGPILLLGSGLTMVDAALSLDRVAPGRPLVALSRRGLTPREHQGAPPSPLPAPPPGVAVAGPGPGLAARGGRRHHGWRTAIDAAATGDAGPVARLEPGAARRLPAPRPRVLGRASPSAVARKSPSGWRGCGPRAGCGSWPASWSGPTFWRGGRAGLVWRPRGETDTWRLEADLVSTAPDRRADVERSTEPLIAALAARGLIRADPLRLGLDIDAEHRVVRADGAPQAALFAVGPITRGALWEINAVPDIRVQAAEVAAAALRALARPGG
jgi:uncharacterized NAD(P)/FAD-binding protein YdhS